MRPGQALAALGLGALLLAGGCALQREQRVTDFDMTLRQYGGALRWGYYDTAARTIRPRADDPEPLPCTPRADLRVTSFQARDVVIDDESGLARVRALIGYVEVDTGAVKEASEGQTWWYDEASKRWFVAEGLPRVLCQGAGDTR